MIFREAAFTSWKDAALISGGGSHKRTLVIRGRDCGHYKTTISSEPGDVKGRRLLGNPLTQTASPTNPHRIPGDLRNIFAMHTCYRRCKNERNRRS